MDDKQRFLEYLKKEYQVYAEIPASQWQKKRESKQYLRGLMMASRMFGISFDELSSVVSCESNQASSIDATLDVPTFVRKNIDIKSL